MADTVRSKATLVSLFPDNSAGSIEEQDSRDFIVSVLGVYGALYVSGGTTAQAVGLTWITLDWTDGANGAEDNANADYTADGIEVGAGGDGVYLVIFQASITGSASEEFSFKASIDGTRSDAASCKLTLDAAGASASCGFAALLTLAAGEQLTIEAVAGAAGKSFTVEEAQLVLKRIG